MLNVKEKLTASEDIVLDVPDGVGVAEVRIAGHLLLLVSPFGKLLRGGS